MKLNRKKKIEKIPLKESQSYALTVLHYKNGTIRATDGYCAVMITPEERDEHDVEGPIPVAAIKPLRKIANLKLDEKFAITSDGNQYLRVGMNDFRAPEIEACIPKGKPERIIKLSARRLYNIAQAIGKDEIEIEIYRDEDAFKIRGYRDPDENTFGILMPMR